MVRPQIPSTSQVFCSPGGREWIDPVWVLFNQGSQERGSIHDVAGQLLHVISFRVTYISDGELVLLSVSMEQEICRVV